MFCSRTRHRQDSEWSWFACFCASVNQVLQIGFSVSFGVLLPELMKEFNESRQNTVWLGSLAFALTFFLCPLGSTLCKKIGCSVTAIAGGLTCAVGLLLTSYSCNLPLMFFTFSFIFGLGASLIFTSSFLITAKNFHKYQSLAVGVVSVGGSVGVLFFGPFLQFLLETVGWRGTYRITSALFCLVCVCGASFSEPLDDEDKNPNQKCAVESANLQCPSREKVSEHSAIDTRGHSNLAFKDDQESTGENLRTHVTECASRTDLRATNVEKTLNLATSTTEADIQDVKAENKAKKGGLIDFSVFKVPRFTIAIASLLLMCMGHYTPQLHLVKYCLELGISADSASKLFIFIGLTSSVARVVVGRLCDISWVNRIYLYQFGNLLVGFMTVTLPVIRGYTGMLLFALVYGVGDGIFITTMNSMLVFTVDEKRREAALGLGCCLLSLGIAAGPPLAGFLADKYDCYMWSFMVAGLLAQCAGILPASLVCLKQEERSLRTQVSMR